MRSIFLSEADQAERMPKACTPGVRIPYGDVRPGALHSAAPLARHGFISVSPVFLSISNPLRWALIWFFHENVNQHLRCKCWFFFRKLQVSVGATFVSSPSPTSSVLMRCHSGRRGRRPLRTVILPSHAGRGRRVWNSGRRGHAPCGWRKPASCRDRRG